MLVEFVDVFVYFVDDLGRISIVGYEICINDGSFFVKILDVYLLVNE